MKLSFYRCIKRFVNRYGCCAKLYIHKTYKLMSLKENKKNYKINKNLNIDV